MLRVITRDRASCAVCCSSPLAQISPPRLRLSPQAPRPSPLWRLRNATPCGTSTSACSGRVSWRPSASSFRRAAYQTAAPGEHPISSLHRPSGDRSDPPGGPGGPARQWRAADHLWVAIRRPRRPTRARNPLEAPQRRSPLRTRQKRVGSRSSSCMLTTWAQWGRCCCSFARPCLISPPATRWSRSPTWPPRPAPCRLWWTTVRLGA